VKENLFSNLRDLWTLTRFEGREMSRYAESLMFSDASRGVRTLGIVSMMMLSLSAVAYAVLEFDSIYVYSTIVLAALSLHVAISSRAVRETRALYLLGTTLLVVSGVAFVLLAHHAQSLNASLFVGVMLLFLVMPLVPWGLREALLIVVLVYSMFTLSTISVEGRFDERTLWMLQLMMLAGGVTTLTVVARNALIRRDDIRTRFQLEQAHDHMEMLSLKDPLTGAWNRRFLEQRFEWIRDRAVKRGAGLQFALIDVDDFKAINDSYGHGFGDQVLCQLVKRFEEVMDQDDYLVRLGGDEFLVLMSHHDTVERIEQAVSKLSQDPELKPEAAKGDIAIAVSVGLVLDGHVRESLDAVYQAADSVLYESKSDKQRGDRQFIRIHQQGAGSESVA